MNDLRQNPRIDCTETAILLIDDIRQLVEVVDVSYGGIGIIVSSEKWVPFDEVLEIKGEIELVNGTTCFDGRICWTSTTEDMTKVGLQIKNVPQDSWRHWVDQIKGIDVPEAPMFDVG